MIGSDAGQETLADSGFILKLQVFTANSMISASALRNQGAADVVRIARDYAGTLRLRDLAQMDRPGFSLWLDARTAELVERFPHQARNWGAARKSLNIFLRSAAYTVPLAREYQLDRLVPHLEVPLDSRVAGALRELDSGLPEWPGLRRLESPVSGLYQATADRDAHGKGVHRADLDVFYWVPQPLR